MTSAEPSRQGKVAFAIQHFPPFMGGAERQANLLADLLSMHLGTCEVITTRFRPDLPSESETGAVQIRRLPTWGRGRLRLVSNLGIAFLFFLLQGHRYRIVHAHCLSAFALGKIGRASCRERV